MHAHFATAWRVPRTSQIGPDQLIAVVGALPMAVITGLASAVIAVVSFWGSVPTEGLLAWFGCCLLIAAAQLSRFRRPRSLPTTFTPDRLRHFVLTSALIAFPWAALVILYLGKLPHVSELVLVAICCGMAAGGSILLAPIYPAALAYAGVILIPAVVKCFLLASSGYAPLGLLTIVYGAFLVAVVSAAARVCIDRSEALRAMTQLSSELGVRDETISMQNARFETALNNISQGVCFFDKSERLIVCNTRYVEMYDLDAEQVRPGITLREIVEMRRLAGTNCDMSTTDYLGWRVDLAKGDKASDAIQPLSNGGSMQIHYRPLSDGGWVATHEDITERQRLAEALERNHRLLRERTTLLQAIIDNFPGGIGFFDRDLRVVVCNDKAKKILDLPDSFFANGPPLLEDILRFNALRGEYGPGDLEEQVASKLALAKDRLTYHFERIRPDGTVLDVRGAPIDNGGFITTYMDITDRHRTEAKIAHMASHDALTGLVNRTVFLERLDNAIGASRAGDRSVAVMMLDLNKFKQVNDTHGHPSGDALLKTVADRLTGCARAGETIARLGGDEFAIVLHVQNPAADAAAIAERILKAMNAPFVLDGHSISAGVSIGVAVASADEADAERLIKQADVALYRAKAEGGNRYRLFDDETGTDVRLHRVA